MDFEQAVVDAIVKSLSKRLGELNRRHLVTALSIPATALGHEYKKALRNELHKQRRTAKRRQSRGDTCI